LTVGLYFEILIVQNLTGVKIGPLFASLGIGVIAVVLFEHREYQQTLSYPIADQYHDNLYSRRRKPWLKETLCVKPICRMAGVPVAKSCDPLFFDLKAIIL
jgi:hypothetical protein